MAGLGDYPLPQTHRVDLTPREFEVLRLVADGLSNAEIAKVLTIAPDTAKHHLSHLLAKFGVKNRTNLVVVAYRAGWISGPPNR